jgi:hypothetical protein
LWYSIVEGSSKHMTAGDSSSDRSGARASKQPICLNPIFPEPFFPYYGPNIP